MTRLHRCPPSSTKQLRGSSDGHSARRPASLLMLRGNSFLTELAGDRFVGHSTLVLSPVFVNPPNEGLFRFESVKAEDVTSCGDYHV